MATLPDDAPGAAATREPGATGQGPAQEGRRLSLALEAAGAGAWDCDPATGEVWMSPRCRGLHGLPDGPDLTPEAWLGSVHPEDRAMVEAALRAALDGGAPLLLRYRARRADAGAPRWIEVRGGRPAGEGRLSGLCLDVTAQKAAEESAALQMREVDHRARNVLATVQALLRLTRADSPADYARALEGRVAALVRAQALLAPDRADGAGLRRLLEAEFAPYAAGGPSRLVLRGPDLVLSRAVVQPLSMAVHELVTNAAKHGALSRPGGQVVAAWSLAAEAGGLCLDWQELGGPPVGGVPERQGFGSGLLHNVVSVQLGGRVERRWEAEGLRCRITLPRACLEVGTGSPERAANPAAPGRDGP